MAYIDVGGTAQAQGGAGLGGAAGQAPGGQPSSRPGVPGSGAPGTDAHIRNWVIGFYVIIALVLTGTGLLFNKHAK